MARERRSRDEAAAAPGGGHAPERASRVPSGPGFALTVGIASGLAAAALAFAAVFAGGGRGATEPGDVLDTGGIEAARLLAAAGSERWKPGFGSTALIRQRAKEVLDTKIGEGKDGRERTARTSAVDDWRTGKNVGGSEWRPGFDMIFPPRDANDDIAEEARRRALNEAFSGVNDVIGVAVLDAAGSLLLGAGKPFAPQGAAAKQIGETKVFKLSPTVRQYEHPLRNRAGAPDGRAVVALQTPPAASPTTAAALAALGALVGGFVVGFMVALGPVKAIRRLAQDADAVAAGRWDTRIGVAGPVIVQHVARSLQRIVTEAANIAATGEAAPQVVEQQVMVQPVAEVQEGLSPLKSFKRPDEFEIEATQKPCPDLGNDYYEIMNVDDDNVGVLVADIPNVRGVRGAMYMAQVRALFRAAAPGQTSPAEALKALNRTFAAGLPRGIYVTAMYAIVSRSTGICKVASAQHLPLIVWKLSKKASARLAPEGIALGLDPGPVFDKTIADKSIQLERGDRIVLYTDGAITARNLSGAEYGEERFHYVVNREAPKNSAACVNFVANDVDLFHEGAAQMDDFTIVTVRKTR